MKNFYEIHVNGNRIGKSACRDDAYEYIKEEHADIMPFLEYNPIGVGDIEIWENGLVKIEIKKLYSPSNKINVVKVLESNIKNEKNEKNKVRFIEKNVSKVMPCTPTRTRLKKENGEMEKAKEGKIMVKNGKKYISKKDKNGNYKWNIYHEEKYSKNNLNKRKSPKFPAKDYKEGTVKKGLDGNNWKVKILASGNKKWVKK